MVATLSVSSTGAVSATVTAARYDRATLSLKDSGEQPLPCQFNPTEYSITRSATWRRWLSVGSASAARAQFVGADPASMGLDLFFDSRQDGSPPVSEAVNRLLSWTQPTDRSIQQKHPTPPVVVFEWGAAATFDAYLSSVTARFVLFRRDGSPIRAHVSLQLQEIPAPLPATNPTSGSDVALRRRTLAAGETLPLVAWQEYGRADDWRAIAEASGIDDPSRLAPGTVLVIPEQSTGEGRR